MTKTVNHALIGIFERLEYDIKLSQDATTHLETQLELLKKAYYEFLASNS